MECTNYFEPEDLFPKSKCSKENYDANIEFFLQNYSEKLSKEIIGLIRLLQSSGKTIDFILERPVHKGTFEMEPLSLFLKTQVTNGTLTLEIKI